MHCAGSANIGKSRSALSCTSTTKNSKLVIVIYALSLLVTYSSILLKTRFARAPSSNDTSIYTWKLPKDLDRHSQVSPSISPSILLQRTMEIEERHGRSFSTRLLQACIRPFGSRLVKPGKPLPPGSPQLSVPSSAKKRCTVTERKVADTWLYDFVPKTQQIKNEPSSRRIYYFAGGGFQSPPASQHWSLLAELACAVPAVVTLVSYPLAPNSPAKDSIPHLAKLYQVIMQESSSNGEIVTFMGDSAGGNVAFCLVHYVLSQHPNSLSPASVLLISPCADAQNNNPQMKETDKNDPLLDCAYTDSVAEKWTLGMSRKDPLVSPVFCDLGVFKSHNIRLDCIVGTWDVLAPDTLLLLEKARMEGLQGKALIWHEQMHCYVLTWRYGLADGKAGKEWIVEMLKGTR